MTQQEKLREDSRVYKIVKQELSNKDFHILRLVYSVGSDPEEWRNDLSELHSEIQKRLGRIKFNPVIYEYICIKHLTGYKLKSIHIKNNSVRRNSKRLKKELNDMRLQAEENAIKALSANGVIE